LGEAFFPNDFLNSARMESLCLMERLERKAPGEGWFSPGGADATDE
jgi:hypothetical protein